MRRRRFTGEGGRPRVLLGQGGRTATSVSSRVQRRYPHTAVTTTTWARASVILVALAFSFLGCRQLLGVDESQPLVDAGTEDVAGDTGPGTDAGSPFTVFHSVP